MPDVTAPPDLLALTPAGGCACKIPLDRMEALLESLGGQPAAFGGRADNLVPGTQRDDAALYALSGDLTLAFSTDFGTPVSRDAETWGRIAAMNTVSDIYAMGAEPFLALGILGWPAHLPHESVARLMRGAVSALRECSTQLAGGHSIASESPIFGLCVVGAARPDRVMLNGNARPGHRLIVTKPLGTGIVVAGQKAEVATVEAVLEAESVMLASNRAAAELARDARVDAATDITGYGLVGHLRTMLLASGCSAAVVPEAVPVLPYALELAEAHGIVPNSAERTYFALEGWVDWCGLPFARRMAFCDPQTSGGLLLAAPPERAQALLRRAAECGQMAVDVGEVTDTGTPGTIMMAPGNPDGAARNGR
ncbi:selenide, water dikinase SelD [Streptomyces sp. NPDC059070]|uniref:selenide, water dikinase SelD n=1 Tax=Streptomyces sp. NPDC059070 TaxID=3346713 RepID=UPI0036AAB71D